MSKENITAAEMAIKIDANFPHLNNHEIVLELAKIEDRLDILEARLTDGKSQG